MSKAAFSAKVFAIYLFIVGPVLVVAPNFLLAIFRIAPTADVWIRVVGVTAFMIGVYVWVAAKHDIKPFLEASVYTRTAVCVLFAAFVVLELASPMLILFGLVDLAGGVWTWFALRADAGAGRPVGAALH